MLRNSDLERGTVLRAGAGRWSAGVSAESSRLLRALLVELRYLSGLTDALEIDSNHAALVTVGWGSVLRRGGSSVLAGWCSILAGRGTRIAALGLGARVLALLAQQDLTNLFQQLGIYVLSLRGLRASADGLVLTTRAERR